MTYRDNMVETVAGLVRRRARIYGAPITHDFISEVVDQAVTDGVIKELPRHWRFDFFVSDVRWAATH